MLADLERELTMNIIYVGGTVDVLLPFVPTLLHHSRCRYRLVSNACTPQEEQTLQAFCATSPRLAFHSLQTPTMLRHGVALNQLQQLEQGPYFAFMDSDIFATGPFLTRHLELLQEHAVVCSCLPVWYQFEKNMALNDFTILAGRHFRDKRGSVLGTTYYAIYRNREVGEAIRQHGVGFEPYNWDRIPRRHQQLLKTLDLQMTWYDTAKVLNILLREQGASVAFEETPNLVHIGAISVQSRKSTAAAREERPTTLKGKLLARLPAPLRRTIRGFLKRRAAAAKARLDRYASPEERENAALNIQRRDIMHRYITTIVDSGGSNRDLDALLADLPEKMRQGLMVLGEQVRTIHEDYRREQSAPAQVG